MDLITCNAARLGMTPTEALEGGFLDFSGNVLPAHPNHYEGTTTMITPVTPNLVGALDRTGFVLRTVEKSGKKLNDRDAYPDLAHQLEELTVAVLKASASLSLIGVEPVGARFDFAPDTKLAAKMNECISYLRNDATNLLRGGGSFSPYESTHSDNALERIKGLYGLLTSAIVQQVREDLTTISGQSPARLVAVAATVAEAAAQDGKVDQPEPKPQAG